MTNYLPDPLTTSTKPSLIKEEERFDEETLSLQAERILYSVTFPMVFKTALELGVIDTIVAAQGVWLSAADIALRLPTKPTNPEAPILLDRMLVLLVSHSILTSRMVEAGENGQTGNGERLYAAEPVCMFFLNRGEGSGSLASLFMVALSEVSAHGMKLFEYIGSKEPFGELFNRAMSEASALTMKKVLEVYRGFKDVNTLVDVGGGIGTVINLVVSKYPHIKGINFDLPSVLAHPSVYPGVENVSGDMFKEIPNGDAIFLKVTSNIRLVFNDKSLVSMFKIDIDYEIKWII